MRFVRSQREGHPDWYPQRVHIVREPIVPLPLYARAHDGGVVTRCGHNPKTLWEDVEGYVPCRSSICEKCALSVGMQRLGLWSCEPWTYNCPTHRTAREVKL